jgi:hypothetical protein
MGAKDDRLVSAVHVSFRLPWYCKNEVDERSDMVKLHGACSGQGGG